MASSVFLHEITQKWVETIARNAFFFYFKSLHERSGKGETQTKVTKEFEKQHSVEGNV
jgi:hypothetical protein